MVGNSAYMRKSEQNKFFYLQFEWNESIEGEDREVHTTFIIGYL